jgi:hypothetical protein
MRKLSTWTYNRLSGHSHECTVHSAPELSATLPLPDVEGFPVTHQQVRIGFAECFSDLASTEDPFRRHERYSVRKALHLFALQILPFIHARQRLWISR